MLRIGFIQLVVVLRLTNVLLRRKMARKYESEGIGSSNGCTSFVA